MRDWIPPLLRRALPAALASLLLLVSCGDGSRVRVIEQSRTYTPVDGGFAWNATPQERFRISLPSAAARGDAPTAGSGSLHWSTPSGWSELPTSSLRQANFLVGEDGTTECYLTILAGDGGGLVANVNRWRKQMSLPEASPDEIAGLERAPFFGGEASFVDLAGTFSGMSGDEVGGSYRMVGFVQVAPGGARFLKLVGPAAVVEAELENFLTLAASFHQDEEGHAHGDEPTDPHAGMDMGAGMVVDGPAGDSGRFRWQDPEGWSRGPDRPMREVSYQVGEAECYVTLLGGAGGGVTANINRWREQMGAEVLSEAEITALPRIPFLGGEAVLVEIPGAYVGMGDADVPEALMLGAVCMLGDASVFVKMIGPRATVEAEREAFQEFCGSMEFAR
jgi:hypothetical protein